MLMCTSVHINVVFCNKHKKLNNNDVVFGKLPKIKVFSSKFNVIDIS